MFIIMTAEKYGMRLQIIFAEEKDVQIGDNINIKIIKSKKKWISLSLLIDHEGNLSFSNANSRSFSFFMRTPKKGISFFNWSILIPLFKSTPIQSRSSEVEGNFLSFVIARNA